jgi:hypothetical protein
MDTKMLDSTSHGVVECGMQRCVAEPGGQTDTIMGVGGETVIRFSVVASRLGFTGRK